MNPADQRSKWFEVAEVEELSSPCLLLYAARVQENIRRMLAIAGGPERLRPHIKTHKMKEVLELQRFVGITKFKCATIAEAEMAADAGANDVLLAYQMVGPAVRRIAALAQAYPRVNFSVLADDAGAVRDLSKAVQSAGGRRIEVLVDLDVGQHRTGIEPGPAAVELYRLIAALPGVKPGGLHAYDGHLSEPDPAQRAAACEAAFVPVAALRKQLEDSGLPVPRIVSGGTPTFPVHAKRRNVECSPGTCVLWDAGYAARLHDLDFIPAALVLTRVISKPGPRRLCLDLGHKAIASEMPPPRVQFLNLQNAKPVVHSEEHLVIETENAAELKVGDCLYGLPWHICPTVALHSKAMVIDNNRIAGSWKIAARERRLTI